MKYMAFSLIFGCPLCAKIRHCGRYFGGHAAQSCRVGLAGRVVGAMAVAAGNGLAGGLEFCGGGLVAAQAG